MAKYEYVIYSNYGLEDLKKLSSQNMKDFIEKAYVSDEPHGRCIDADAFKLYLMQSCLKHIGHPNYAEAKRITEEFCRDIDEQPTILEAKP